MMEANSSGRALTTTTIGRLSVERKHHHIRRTAWSLAFKSKALKAKFQIADRSFKGTISPESFARYEGWKQAVSGAAVRG